MGRSTTARKVRPGSGTSGRLIGDSGTGKSHLLIGLGIAAAEAGYRVRYITAAALDRRGAELLFQVFTEREERASVVVASNSN